IMFKGINSTKLYLYILYSLKDSCEIIMMNNLLETIKNTPLVKFENLSKANSISIYGKLEYLNAGKSLKSRTSKNMIDWALENKLLKQGDTVIESSSGNMAIG